MSHLAQRERFKRTLLALGGLAAVLALGLLMAVSGATAADVEIHNSTVAVDDDTSSVYAEMNNTDPASANLTVTWEGIDSDGNVTGTLDTQSVTVANDSVQLAEYQNVNASAYSDVRVTVMLDNTTASEQNVTVTSGTFQKTGGAGGGGFLSGSTGGVSNGVLVLAVLVVGAVLKRGRD